MKKISWAQLEHGRNDFVRHCMCTKFVEGAFIAFGKHDIRDVAGRTGRPLDNKASLDLPPQLIMRYPENEDALKIHNMSELA